MWRIMYGFQPLRKYDKDNLEATEMWIWRRITKKRKDPIDVKVLYEENESKILIKDLERSLVEENPERAQKTCFYC